jgi:uncharacterized ferritin-like protein (DUF455 family)
MALRFAPALAAAGLDAAQFVNDWAKVGGDEARHFRLINSRLETFGSAYGGLPAHDGLWRSAEATSDDVLARLAIAPMALEARGLDVTPALADRLRRAGDNESAEIVSVIYRDEIGHVSVGVRWFNLICSHRGIEPQPTFRLLIGERLAGGLKPPFNGPARAAAGLDPGFYAQAF